MRDVTISAVMNGFVVKVGCQTLVFQKQREMLETLDRYLTNPENVERQFVEQYGLKNSLAPVAPPTHTERSDTPSRERLRALQGAAREQDFYRTTGGAVASGSSPQSSRYSND